MKGLFITFEGGEGAGKSTQISRLAEWFGARGRRVLVTREPGGSQGSEAVRHVLLSGVAVRFGPQMEAILFAAARADHVATLIRPSLEAGEVVLCDRFHDSTRVYQGLSGVASPLIDGLERIALAGLLPDLTLILDLPAATGLERARHRRGANQADRFEREAVAIQEARRTAFLDLAAEHPERCVVIDGTRSVEDVAAEIVAVVENRLRFATSQPDRPETAADKGASVFS